VLGCLHLHDGGYGVCEWGWGMAMTALAKGALR